MLNDAQCSNAKAKEKPYKLTDEKGLYLEVKPNALKLGVIVSSYPKTA